MVINIDFLAPCHTLQNNITRQLQEGTEVTLMLSRSDELISPDAYYHSIFFFNYKAFG